MLDEGFSRVDTAQQDTSSLRFLTHAHPVADALLNTLSSFDLEHEQELGRVRVGSSPQALKNRVLQRLRDRHSARREPCLQQLAQLPRTPEPDFEMIRLLQRLKQGEAQPDHPKPVKRRPRPDGRENTSERG